MTNEILEWSAGKIASQINTGAVTATEVVQTFINQIEAVNPVINAVCTLNENALEEAKAVDAKAANEAVANAKTDRVSVQRAS